jgi:hypothetical protein
MEETKRAVGGFEVSPVLHTANMHRHHQIESKFYPESVPGGIVPLGHFTFD